MSNICMMHSGVSALYSLLIESFGKVFNQYEEHNAKKRTECIP